MVPKGMNQPTPLQPNLIYWTSGDMKLHSFVPFCHVAGIQWYSHLGVECIRSSGIPGASSNDMPWPLCWRSVVGATTITTVGPGRSKPPWRRVSAVGQSICIVGSKEAATWRHSVGVLSPGSAYYVEARDDIEMGDLHFYQYRYKYYK